MKYILEYNKHIIQQGRFRIGDIIYPIVERKYLIENRKYKVVKIRYRNEYFIRIWDCKERMYVAIHPIFSNNYKDYLTDDIEKAGWAREEYFATQLELDAMKYNL